MTSSVLNSVNSIFNPLQLTPKKAQQANLSPEEMKGLLRSYGCRSCELGCQKNFIAPVVFRGNSKSDKMIIGEAPGLEEDKGGVPFVGPAGKLLDKIFASAGLDTNKDFYITNVSKCRPVSSEPTKQNNTPTSSNLEACRGYLVQEIKYLQPKIVIMVGGSAAKSLLKQVNFSIIEDAGKIFYSEEFPFTTFFAIYHPAYLLHKSKFPEEYKIVKQKMWKDIKLLRSIIHELE